MYDSLQTRSICVRACCRVSSCDYVATCAVISRVKTHILLELHLFPNDTTCPSRDGCFLLVFYIRMASSLVAHISQNVNVVIDEFGI
jgi:hypothetical protein